MGINIININVLNIINIIKIMYIDWPLLDFFYIRHGLHDSRFKLDRRRRGGLSIKAQTIFSAFPKQRTKLGRVFCHVPDSRFQTSPVDMVDIVDVVYLITYKVLAPSQVVIAGFLNHQ